VQVVWNGPKLSQYFINIFCEGSQMLNNMKICLARIEADDCYGTVTLNFDVELN
jgi:hypothetical protein